MNPPKLLLRFLRWFCHPKYLEDIEGDLMERFEKRMGEKGVRAAGWGVFKDVLTLIKPGLINWNLGKYYMTKTMIFNFLKVSCRHLLRNKKYTAINLSGLIVGMSATFILLKHIGFFLMWDQSQVHKEEVFKVYQRQIQDGQEGEIRPSTYFGLGSYVKEKYTEVISMSHYITTIETLVTAEKENGEFVKFNEGRIAEADPDFLAMFPLVFIHGNPANALSEPNTVILTESTAKKYFQEQNPIGKTLTTTTPWAAKYHLRVTGVVMDPPLNSSFRFDFLKSLLRKHREIEPEWTHATYRTYVMLKNPEVAPLLSEAIANDLSSFEQFQPKNKSFHIELRAISKRELTDVQRLLALVGILILIITWINYANLSSTKSFDRIREIGIRKIIGSAKSQVAGQFVVEGLLIHILALSISALLIWIFYPIAKNITGGQLLSMLEFKSSINLGFIGLFMLGAFVSSIYPSFTFSQVLPIKMLKERLIPGTKRTFIRKGLVILQFCISTVLIISVTVIFEQLKYMQDWDLGVNMDRTIIIKAPKDGWEGKRNRLRSFKNKARSMSQVESVASSSTIPGRFGGSLLDCALTKTGEPTRVTLFGIDEHFIHAYGIELIAGHSYKGGQSNKNNRSIILNQSAAQRLGTLNAHDLIGQRLYISGHDWNGREESLEIIGVMADYHHESLMADIHPIIFEFNTRRGFISVKLNAANYENYDRLSATLEQMESSWNQVYTNQVFDYYFLDEQFNQQYDREVGFRRTFGIFTAISIFITCLGLFGLSMFMAVKRKKEVGIRKTFGASIFNILMLFFKEFIGQIAIAILIGIPIAYYTMSGWLEDFSYRTSINFWTLSIPSILLVMLSIIAISMETFKSATINPIDSLRNE